MRVESSGIPVADTEATLSSDDVRGRIVEVVTPRFVPTAAGSQSVRVRVDPLGRIAEHNEANNTLAVNLLVRRLVYDMQVEFLSMVSRANKDDTGKDEYELTMYLDPPRGSRLQASFRKSGNPNNVYSIGQSLSVTDLRDGDHVLIGTTMKENDGGLRDGDDYMGSNWIPSRIVGRSYTAEAPEVVKHYESESNKGQYEVKVRATIRRREI